MPQELQPFSIRNFGIFGVIREAEIDPNLIPDEAVIDALNVHFDRKGAMTVRPGLLIIGTTIGSGTHIFGLYSASFNNAASGTLVAVASDGTNNDVYKYQPWNTTWSKTLEDDTKNSKTRFVMFVNRLIRVNGNDSMRAWDGIASSWETSGNPANVDDMDAHITKYIEVFKSKVYTAGKTANPDRLYFSSVISSAGNITWDSTVDFVDINPSDGENISALKRFGLHLLIFKPNYIYRHAGISGLDPEPFANIGTRSQESIVVAKDGCYFHHDSGFYKYAGGLPSEISRPISDIINAIPKSSYTEIYGWKDDDHVYWNIGDLTVNGIQFLNTVVRYTISSEIWTIYSYPNELKFGINWDKGNSIVQVVGDETGKIYEFNNGYTDNSTAISYRMTTKWYEIGGIFNTKILNWFSAIAEKAQGMILMYQVDDDPVFKEIGQLRSYLTHYKNQNIKFHRIRFKITGSSKNEAPIFRGIWILKGLIEGFSE